MALDLDIVFNNILTLGILAGIGYIIFQKARGRDTFEKFRMKFGKVFQKSKLR